MTAISQKSERYFGMGLPEYIFNCRLRENLSVASNNARVKFVGV